MKPTPKLTKVPPDPEAADLLFSRGDPSRRALLMAAASVFGEKGLDGATTREIARRAGQNISAIKYYFEGKDGLYLAVAQEIGREIGSRLGAVSAVLDAAAKPIDPGMAHELLKRLIATMVRTMMIAEFPAIAQFIVREQQNPTPAFDMIYEGGMRGAHETITRLIAIMLGLRETSTDAVLRAHALMGQVLGFRVARAALLRRTGWREVGPNEAVQITEAVLAGLDLMFAGRVGKHGSKSSRSKELRR